MRAKDEKVRVALPSRARLFLALLARCFMALFFAGLTVAGILPLIIVISDVDPAMIDATGNVFAVALLASVSGLTFALMVYVMQKTTAVNMLPPPHLPEDDD